MPKNLQARIEVLERMTESRDSVYLAWYRDDGSLVPLKSGECYGQRVVLVPAQCETTVEWLKRYTPHEGVDSKAAQQEQEETQRRARQALRCAVASQNGGAP